MRECVLTTTQKGHPGLPAWVILIYTVRAQSYKYVPGALTLANTARLRCAAYGSRYTVRAQSYKYVPGALTLATATA